MAELLFCVALLAGILALGMYKAPLWAWAGCARRRRAHLARRGRARAHRRIRLPAMAVRHRLRRHGDSRRSPRLLSAPASSSSSKARCRRSPTPSAGARRRHRRLGRRAVLRHARLGQAAPRPAHRAHRRGAAFLDGPTEELCAHAQRLADPPRAARHSRRRSGTSSRRTASSAC